VAVKVVVNLTRGIINQVFNMDETRLEALWLVKEDTKSAL
jgi:hypothetical protein